MIASKQIKSLGANEIANLWNATAAIGNTRRGLLPEPVVRPVAEPAQPAADKGPQAKTPVPRLEVVKPPALPGVDFATVGKVRIEPEQYSNLYHGTDAHTLGFGSNVSAEEIAQNLYLNGLPARGPNADLIQHAVDGASDTAFRGTTRKPLTQNQDAGASLWAGEGGIVIRFTDVGGYDINAALEGRVPRIGGYGGNPKYGEEEIAVSGRISPQYIARIGVVLLREDSGKLEIKWIDKNRSISNFVGTTTVFLKS